MSKIITSVCIDSELHQLAKANNLNLSRLLEEAIRVALNIEKPERVNEDELKQKEAELRAELMKIQELKQLAKEQKKKEEEEFKKKFGEVVLEWK